ncbi:MAG TPA: hypothetical protein VKW77_07250 [Acidimicrobiales bacterium]|nr:hypothetical protein [Acidimicrobiales bacterium]
MVAAACGSSSSSSTTTTSRPHSNSTTSASQATVMLAQVPGVGQVLVNSQGRTLYLFTPDRQSTPTCTGGCASAWPPLVANGTPVAGPGVRASLLGTVHNPDGTTQVTYDRWPLYTFAGDSGAGQAHGQGINSFGGHWAAVTSSGTMVGAAGQSAGAASGSSGSSATGGSGGSTSTTKGSSGGYGY